jgi:hypothetical protein
VVDEFARRKARRSGGPFSFLRTETTMRNQEFQVRFPGFEFEADPKKYRPCWVRTYPPDMEMSDQDHLAVASGAWARYEEWGLWAFWKDAQGRWVEDLSGVAFEDVDVAYLDWLCANAGYVSRRVQNYRVGAGKGRFVMDVHASADDRRDPGWMYATVGTFLYYQDRKDSFAERGESGAWGATPWAEDTDDGWATGRVWGSEDPDYHARYEGPWATLSRALEELEDVYARAVELGPDLVPPDSDVGPYAYVCDRVRRLVESLPAFGGDATKERVFRTIRERADDILEELRWLRVDDPTFPDGQEEDRSGYAEWAPGTAWWDVGHDQWKPAAEEPTDGLSLGVLGHLLKDYVRERVAAKVRRVRRKVRLASGDVARLDVALCE